MVPQSRFLSAYYVGNALVLASYVALRTLAEQADEGASTQLKTFETQGLAVLGFNFVLKTMKVHSVDHLVSLTFMYGKTVLLVLTYFASTLTFAVALVEVACVTLLTVQPMYDGPSRIETLTPATMPTVAATPDAKQIIMLYAGWSSACIHFMPAFAALSRKYACDDKGRIVRFGSLDLAVWPGVAKSSFNVDMNATSSQLPTIVLYNGGKEVDRLPRVGAKGRWTAADVERIFGLKTAEAAKDKKA